MKKLELSQIVGILANLGVIASIIFLGMEVRGNATQARVSALQNMTGQLVGWRYRITADPSLAAIYVAGLDDYYGLEQPDKVRFEMLMTSLLGVVAAAIQARDAGLVSLTPELQSRSLEGRIFRHLDYPGFRQWWETVDKRDIPTTMRALVDELNEVRAREMSSE